MSDDFRGRRRLQRPGRRRPATGSGGGPSGWLITIAAVIVVLVAGWFLGMALAHVVGGRHPRTANLPTPIPLAAASPSPTAGAAVSPSPSLPAATPTPAPVPTHGPRKTAAPAVAPVATPTLTPVITPSPVPSSLPTKRPPPAPAASPAALRTASPAAAPAAGMVSPVNTAAQIVRRYIDAMKAGNLTRAQQFLGNGSPDESFISSSTRIASITSKPNADGSFNVAADMRASGTEYYETFVVAPTPSGDRILQKTAIKP